MSHNVDCRELSRSEFLHCFRKGFGEAHGSWTAGGDLAPTQSGGYGRQNCLNDMSIVGNA